MVWGWQIAWYLFLGGLGAGATLTSLVASRTGSRFAAIERAGATLAGPAVAFGTALLVVDLGMGRREPWRLVYLYLNWQSPMTWGTWILTLFIPIALLHALAVTGAMAPRFERLVAPVRRVCVRAQSPLKVAAGVLALSTAIYTGVLLSVPPSFPLLSSWLLPVLFLISALSTGLSAAVLVGYFRAHRQGIELDLHNWSRVHIGLVTVELGVLLAWLAVGSASPAGSASVQLLVSGELAPVFWIGVVLVGLVAPVLAFVVETAPRGHSCRLALTGEAGVLAGGLALRYLVLLAAVPVIVGPAL
ncbi:MAG TPA: NrfD/PsrC family molybdoenzyme membrane anchor subunit [Dermatophilaceae bacterium]|nr:NrfD/PsrC family molybdoenzyme membrane anchor subunit [Dermatophilaceae bacterium]